MKLALLILAALPLAGAGDIAGKWAMEGDVVGNPVNLDCSIEQKGEGKIGGTCTEKGGDGSESLDIAGEAKAEKFSFSFTTSSGYTLTYTGTVEGDAVKGDIEVSGANGSFTGKRVVQ